jgi:GNAT superfamily N-acetyltransferase
MTELPLRIAAPNDIAAIVKLVNAAFAVERFFVDADRTNDEEIAAYLQKGQFLLHEEAAQLIACVYVELRGERGYFGMLSVDKTQQGKGLGARMVAASEDYCRAAGCREIELLIVNVRKELPPFYRRLGYQETGTEPFPDKAGLRLPCHFVRMAKPL